MKLRCQLCDLDYTFLLSKPQSPVVLSCGHALCLKCLKAWGEGEVCYLKCAPLQPEGVRFVRLKYIDSGLPNWKKILNSKSLKLLQELNLNLDKQATELDDKRAILAKSLQDYSGGMLLEQALHEVCAELEALETQDIALRQQVTQEMEKLSELEEKIARTSGRGCSQRLRGDGGSISPW